MNNSKTKGGSTASSFTVPQLEAQIADLLRQAESHKRLSGIKIEFAEGISDKTKKPWSNITVQGIKGMGWKGLQLRPESWSRLKELIGDIDEAMALHYPDYQG